MIKLRNVISAGREGGREGAFIHLRRLALSVLAGVVPACGQWKALSLLPGHFRAPGCLSLQCVEDKTMDLSFRKADDWTVDLAFGEVGVMRSSRVR